MNGIISVLSNMPVFGKLNRSRFSCAIKSFAGLMLLISATQFFTVQAQAATYSFVNIPFAWDTPSGTATTVTWSGLCTAYPGGDDDYALVNIPSGFTFTFAGTAYSQVRVMSNGVIQFGAADQGFHRDYTPVALPAPASNIGIPAGCPNLAPTNLLQMYWLDINTAPNIAGALVQYELLGSSPSRRLVITHNNVALYGNTATRYTFQVVLRESASGVNGNFEYRYTSGSSTGTGATVGVQVGAADYTQYAYNQAFIDTTNGTNILWYPQTTLASAAGIYHFDEASWNTTAGQVIDSSGNSQNATSVGTATTVATTKCGSGRSGSFPSNTSNALIYAVATPFTPGKFGAIDFWYYSNVAWNAANSQAMLFDATTVAGRPFYLMKTATGALQFTVSDSAAAISTTTSAAQAFAANTWQHVGVSWVFLLGSNQTYMQIFLNGALLTSARYTTTGTIASLSTLYIGDNRTSGVTPSAGTPNSANGLIDEVNIYNAQINAYQATADMSCIALIDHLLIQSSGTGLTCAANTLTIVACQNAACTVNYTAGVTGTLTPSSPTVNWDGTTGGAIGAGFATGGSGTASKNVQVPTAGTVTFGIATPTPVPFNATACNFGTNSPANNNCVFTANSVGFIISNSVTGSSYTIPAQVSGIAATGLYLRAVQASTTNPAVCTPAIISSTTSVSMGYTCNNPATCQAGNLATINATAIAPAGTAVSMAFDANGSSPITVRYDDVGRITLTSTATVTPFGGATAVTLTGSSNAFVVAPHHFGFSSVTAGLIKAGNPFSATVTAQNALGATTPNFGKETAPEGVTLSSNLVSPAGGNNPVLANNAIAGGTFVNGVATVNNLSWGDVGLITLTGNLTSGSTNLCSTLPSHDGYLCFGQTATGTSANVGRFIPDHFDTITSGGMPCPTGLTCPIQFNGFIYSGQPFTTQLIARNLGGGTTLNYDSARGYSKAVTLTAWNAAGGATANPGGGALTLNTVPSTAFNLGVATTSTPTYTFTTTPTAPTDVYIRADESLGGDGVTSLRGVSSVEGGIKVVSGRLKISSAHGSELLPLPIGVTIQYWNNTNYVTSTTDSTTVIANAAINAGLNNWQKKPATSTFAAGSTSAVAPPASVAFVNGVGSFKLAAPGAGATGSVDINNIGLSYLPGNIGRATFGVYKGANEFIYLRENY